MIYFNKLIDICINRQENQRVVNNYFVGTKRLNRRIKRKKEEISCKKLIFLLQTFALYVKLWYNLYIIGYCTTEYNKYTEECNSSVKF